MKNKTSQSNRYEYEMAVQEIALGIRAADESADDIRRNTRYMSDYDKADVQRIAAKWTELANDLTERNRHESV